MERPQPGLGERQRESKHSEHLLLPSEDGVLLIQVSAGSERDEAGENKEVRKQQAGPPVRSRLLKRRPFPAWSFLGPMYD